MKRLIHPRFFFGLVLVITLLFVFYSPRLPDLGMAMTNMFRGKGSAGHNEGTDALRTATSKKIEQIEGSLKKLTPQSAYMVINTTENRFELFNKGEKVREGFCSTGSLTRLHTDSDRQWVFKTPKGRMSIQSKITSPVWIKPDWAFIEEGLPVPPAGHASRYESGVLGDYALSLGRGYLIHGTLYQRLLGMPVTHGCVRLGDDDLEAVYKTLSIGSKVYIF